MHGLLRKAATLKRRYVAYPKLILIFTETEQQFMLSGGRTMSGKEE